MKKFKFGMIMVIIMIIGLVQPRKIYNLKKKKISHYIS